MIYSYSQQQLYYRLYTETFLPSMFLLSVIMWLTFICNADSRVNRLKTESTDRVQSYCNVCKPRPLYVWLHPPCDERMSAKLAGVAEFCAARLRERILFSLLCYTLLQKFLDPPPLSTQ